MVRPGVGLGLDTPRTNMGDATYVSRQLPGDFDISHEASFQSPSKDGNVLHQVRNCGGGRLDLKTPRGTKSHRAPFAERRNVPGGVVGGNEFTPLLKSATRNSARRAQGSHHGAGRIGGKENTMCRIDEDMMLVPAGDSSVYGVSSRNASSYIQGTPVPGQDLTETSSAASTPLVLKRRDTNKSDPLADGHQLSLREQESVIDRIEKENFGLKLKIHFLEEALRKAGPGFGEAALKENTELKVDRVTMQRELQRYKKHLTNAEKGLEGYKTQMVELQEKAKKRFADEKQRAEMEKLKRALEDKEADMADLQRRLERSERENEMMDKLRDGIGELEADGCEENKTIGEREDEIQRLTTRLEEAEVQVKKTQRQMMELEEKARASEELEEAKATIVDLEADMRRLEEQVEDMKDKLHDAVAEKDRAEADLEELQEEMANKSVMSQGRSRQVEEKVARLQDQLEKAHEEWKSLEEKYTAQQKETSELKSRVKELRQEKAAWERARQALAGKLEEAQAELHASKDEKKQLQSHKEALADEAAFLQREMGRLQSTVAELEEQLEKERKHGQDVQVQLKDQVGQLKREMRELEEEAERERRHGLDLEDEMRLKSKKDMEGLHDRVSDLQAECREKDKLYDSDSVKWETERQALEAERDRAEARAAGLERSLNKLRETEGSVDDRESRLQEALQREKERHQNEETILRRQISQVEQSLESRQTMLGELRRELSSARDELGEARRNCEAQADKAEALEDEVEVLQAAMDEESDKSRRELEQARQESEQVQQTLQDQLATAKHEVRWLQDQSAAQRHKIRELERRGEDYEAQLAATRIAPDAAETGEDGTSEMSMLHRDLTAARKKEMQLLQREASHKEAIRKLKRELADLERKAHEAALDGLAGRSPSRGAQDLATETELGELRSQLTGAHRAIEDLKRAMREADHKAAASAHGLQARLDEAEEDKLVLEDGLQEARAAMDKAEAAHETALGTFKAKVHNADRYRRERDQARLNLLQAQQRNNGDTATSQHSDHSSMSRDERRDLHAMLRQSQLDSDKLEREVRELREALQDLRAGQASLRVKLERARSERAAYRAGAEQLQKDVRKVEAAREALEAELAAAHETQEHTSRSLMLQLSGDVDTGAIIRASEAAERRHEKELRGLVLHMEWLKACWDREAQLRIDAATAKKYLQLQVDVRDACNKADLAILNSIRAELKPHSCSALSQLSWARRSASSIPHFARPALLSCRLSTKNPFALKRLFLAVRFVVRLQMGARHWAHYEALRLRLAAAHEEREREERMRLMRDQWRADHGRPPRADEGAGRVITKS